jgi:hypothetical protein
MLELLLKFWDQGLLGSIACRQQAPGGILVAWNDDLVEASSFIIKDHSLSMAVTVREANSEFFMTVVYGPSDDLGRPSFLQELQSLKPADSTAWLVLGDFNMIYQASDKNNLNLNPRLMGTFRKTLNECELFEFNLQNHKFTWSNERENPTLVRLDRVFCNKEWDLLLSNFSLLALSSSLSDHCPLILYQQLRPRNRERFCFENFWPRIPGFTEVVQQAWKNEVSVSLLSTNFTI